MQAPSTPISVLLCQNAAARIFGICASRRVSRDVGARWRLNTALPARVTVATDQFLARLDQAIGLSNTLAQALSGAARVLDGVRRGSGLLLPTEQEAGAA